MQPECRTGVLVRLDGCLDAIAPLRHTTSDDNAAHLLRASPRTTLNRQLRNLRAESVRPSSRGGDGRTHEGMLCGQLPPVGSLREYAPTAVIVPEEEQCARSGW